MQLHIPFCLPIMISVYYFFSVLSRKTRTLRHCPFDASGLDIVADLGHTSGKEGKSMRVEGNFVKGQFLDRPNRFVVQAQIDGRPEAAHLADPGRLWELLVPGARLLLKRESGAHRKTGYTVFLVRHGDVWVCVDTRMPNRLAQEALEAGQIAPLRGYAEIEREVTRDHSRFDLRLLAPNKPACWVEVKSVSLVEDGRALFPDAPTLRGARHVRELADVVQAGERAALLFIIQRPDAASFAPHQGRDPAFAQALREAVAQGVEAYAYRALITPGELRITDPVPVELG